MLPVEQHSLSSKGCFNFYCTSEDLEMQTSKKLWFSSLLKLYNKHSVLWTLLYSIQQTLKFIHDLVHAFLHKHNILSKATQLHFLQILCIIYTKTWLLVDCDERNTKSPCTAFEIKAYLLPLLFYFTCWIVTTSY